MSAPSWGLELPHCLTESMYSPSLKAGVFGSWRQSQRIMQQPAHSGLIQCDALRNSLGAHRLLSAVSGFWHTIRRALHVFRRTEIAAPSSAELINPSLSEAAQPGLGTVITQLHLLHPQPSLYGNTFPEDAGWRLQPFKWSSWDQAQIQYLRCQLSLSTDFLPAWERSAGCSDLPVERRSMDCNSGLKREVDAWIQGGEAR
ncbi:hypothetical protein NQZ68_015010 [Dissostichus eleginoides]|nr:hypothetical protein NQZ68_015010 [Dissostichus eleginoides]